MFEQTDDTVVFLYVSKREVHLNLELMDSVSQLDVLISRSGQDRTRHFIWEGKLLSGYIPANGEMTAKKKRGKKVRNLF